MCAARAQAYAALVPVVGGVIVASRFEPLFHVAGVTAAVAATGCRALKSVVQAMLLTDPSERLDPMSTLMYMSAASALLLLPATIALEPGAFAQAAQLAASNPNFLALLAADAALAYFVNLTNFLVTKYVGATGMQVRVCACVRAP